MARTKPDDEELIMVDPTGDMIDYWTTLVQDTKVSGIQPQESTEIELNFFDNSATPNKKKVGKRETRKRVKTILKNCLFPEDLVKRIIKQYVENPTYIEMTIDKVDPKMTFAFDIDTESFMTINELETQGLLKKVEDSEFDKRAFEQAKELVFLDEHELDFEMDEGKSRKPRREEREEENVCFLEDWVIRNIELNLFENEQPGGKEKEQEQEQEEEDQEEEEEEEEKEGESGKEREADKNQEQEKETEKYREKESEKDREKEREREEERDREYGSSKRRRDSSIERSLEKDTRSRSKKSSPACLLSPRSPNKEKERMDIVRILEDSEVEENINCVPQQDKEIDKGAELQPEPVKKVNDKENKKHHYKLSYRSAEKDDYVVTFDFFKGQNKKVGNPTDSTPAKPIFDSNGKNNIIQRTGCSSNKSKTADPVIHTKTVPQSSQGGCNNNSQKGCKQRKRKRHLKNKNKAKVIEIDKCEKKVCEMIIDDDENDVLIIDSEGEKENIEQSRSKLSKGMVNKGKSNPQQNQYDVEPGVIKEAFSSLAQIFVNKNERPSPGPFNHPQQFRMEQNNLHFGHQHHMSPRHLVLPQGQPPNFAYMSHPNRGFIAQNAPHHIFCNPYQPGQPIQRIQPYQIQPHHPPHPHHPLHPHQPPQPYQNNHQLIHSQHLVQPPQPFQARPFMASKENIVPPPNSRPCQYIQIKAVSDQNNLNRLHMQEPRVSPPIGLPPMSREQMNEKLRNLNLTASSKGSTQVMRDDMTYLSYEDNDESSMAGSEIFYDSEVESGEVIDIGGN